MLRGNIKAVAHASACRRWLQPAIAGCTRQAEACRSTLKRAPLLLLLCLPLSAAIWQPQPEPWKMRAATPVQPSVDTAVWQEYGFKGAEQADFGRFRVTAYQFDDSTGAYAASLLLENKPRVFGSYALVCTGACPAPAEYAELLKYLPGRTGGALPGLGSYLPTAGRVPGSERYITGPVSISRFAPRIPAKTAGFQFSAEAATAKYHTPAGDADVAVFEYPTPQIARSEYNDLRKLPGAFAKRTGTLVAVASGIANKNAAWNILNQINHQMDLTMNEAAKSNQAKSLANMMLSVFALAGILIVFCLLSGLAFAGGRVLLQKFGGVSAADPVTTLHLGDK